MNQLEEEQARSAILRRRNDELEEDLGVAESRCKELESALERLLANAERIFDKQPVRDWGETLAEARAALQENARG